MQKRRYSLSCHKSEGESDFSTVIFPVGYYSLHFDGLVAHLFMRCLCVLYSVVDFTQIVDFFVVLSMPYTKYTQSKNMKHNSVFM